MLDALEKSQINNIINPRSQFGDLRYQLKIESLIFENKNTINEANQIYKAYTLGQNDKEKDYLIIAFMRNFAQEQKSQQFQREFIYKQLLNSDGSQQNQLCKQLGQLLSKHFEFSNLQVSQIQQSKVQQQYILELNNQEYQYYQIQKQKNKGQECLAFLIKNRQNELNFQQNQKRLEKQYNVVNYYQKYRNEINSGQILVIIIKQQYTQSDILNYFNQKFYLDTENRILRLYGDPNQKSYYPLSHFNSFFSPEIRQKIGVLSSVDQNDKQLLSHLQRLVFTQENLSNLQMYFLLVEQIDICKQLIEWNQIILNSLEQIEIGNNNQPREQSSIQECKEQLENYYYLLDKRFQDQKFCEWKETIYCKNCLEGSPCNCVQCKQTFNQYDEFNKDNDLKDFLANDSIKGMILYQYCKEGIVIYQRIKKGPNDCQKIAAFVKFFKNSSISGELSQIIISDKEENPLKVFICKFELSENCQKLYKSIDNNEKERQLILEHFLKIAAVKMKRVFLYPKTRENQDEYNKEI